MSQRLNRSNGAVRLVLTVAMLLSFLVGFIVPSVGAAPSAPAATGIVTAITVNSPTSADKFYTAGGQVTVNYTINGSGETVWSEAQVGPWWWMGGPAYPKLPVTDKLLIGTGCIEGVYDVTVRAQGGSQTSPVAGTQFGAVVVDCTNPVVPANPLVAPNGGENLSLGNVFNVTWDPNKITDKNLGANPISLDLQCVIGGVPINAMIAAGLPNTGSYAWTVGGAVGTCLMSLTATDLAGNLGQGVSANTFTISGLDPSAPTVNLLTPPGAATPNWNWVKGGNYDFTANAADPQSGIKKVEFEVSQDLGVTYPFVNAATLGPSPYAFKWNLSDPALPENTELWARAKATNGLDAFTYSNVNKRIKIDRTAPLAGPILLPNIGPGGQLAGTQKLTAKSEDGAGSGVATVVFQYSLNNGTSWTDLPGAYWKNPNNAADFYWWASWDTTGAVPAGTEADVQLREKTTDVAGNSTTTAAFPIHVDNKQPVIAQPFLKVPNGGETWQLGVDHNITWDPTKVKDSKALGISPQALNDPIATLWYSTDGVVWKQITTPPLSQVQFNTGVFNWSGVDNAGLLPGASYKVKIEVQDMAGNKQSDISDQPFTFWNNDDTAPDSWINKVAPLTNGFAKGTVTVTGQGMDLQSGIQAIRFQSRTRTWTGATWSAWSAWSDLGAASTLTYDYPAHIWSGTVSWNTGSFSGQAQLRAIAKNGLGVEPDPVVVPTFDVNVDNSAPKIAWADGYAGQCAASGNAFNLGVNAVESPQGNMASVLFQYSIDGGSRWIDIAKVNGIGPAFNTPWDTTTTLDTSTPPKVIAMPDGYAILRATATNQAGLPSTITDRYVYINNKGTAVSPQVACLVPGWNLYSLPLVVQDNNQAPIDTVLGALKTHGTLNQVRTFVWEGSPMALTAKAWFPAIGGDIQFIQDGQGYWLEMKTADVLVVKGKEQSGPPFPPRSYQVFDGWNLIGFKSVTPKLANDYLTGVQVSIIYGWNAPAQQYVIPPMFPTPNTFDPNSGYWLSTAANGTILP